MTDIAVSDRVEAPTRVSTSFPSRRIFGALKRDWWICGISALVAGVAVLGFSLLQTPMYTSTATLYVTAGMDDNAQAAYQGSLASQKRVTSYVQLAKSDAVLEDALRSSGLPFTIDEAKQSIAASTSPDTVILTLAATTSDPTKSASLVNSVASGLSSYVQGIETPAGGGSPLAKITVVSPGTVEDIPVSPRTKRDTAFGVMVGILVGLVLIAVRFRLDAKIRTTEQVEMTVGRTPLTTVPSEEALKSQRPLSFHDGSSPAAEAYRRLRTNLAFVDIDSPARIILVSSPRENDGKTTVALNLAAALAETSNRVVVVDADLRLPSVAGRLGLNRDIGLTNYLRGDAPIDVVTQRALDFGFDVVTSGTTPPNPSELLASQKMEAAVDQLAETYDYVIVDAPPVLAVADAIAAAQWTQGLLMVLRADVTTMDEVQVTIDQANGARVNILGFVLNDANVGDVPYYQYRYESSDES